MNCSWIRKRKDRVPDPVCTLGQVRYGGTLSQNISMRYPFVSEIIAHGDIVISKVGTQDSPTDMMTKSLPIAKFVHCSNLVRLGC